MSIASLPTFSATALLAASGCRQGAGDGSDGAVAAPAPTVALIDSLHLAESDTASVAQPSAFEVAGDGSYYLADMGDGTIKHFDRAGRRLQTIGRRGQGPGEFIAPSWLAADADSTLYVSDLALRRLTAIRTRTDSVLWQRATTSGFMTSMDASLGGVYFGMVDAGKRGTIGFVRGPTDSVTVYGPHPELFDRVPPAAQVFAMVELAAQGGTVASAYEVSDHVYLTSRDGRRVDSILVPVVRRRGARLDLFRRMTAEPSSVREAAYQSSLPFEIAWLRPGLLAYITLEQRQDGRRIVGELYLSLVNVERRRGCSDLLLPLPSDPLPRVTFRGDTLIAVHERLTEGGSRLVVQRFRVDATSCGW